MKPISEEGYFFFSMYAIDLDSALKSIKLIRRYRRQEVREALLRDATIAYVRPFSLNRGRLGKHELSSKHIVPKHMRALHAELVKLRSSQFAHTDLTFYDPKSVLYGKGRPDLVFKGSDYNALLEKLSDIEDLVKAVESAVIDRIVEYEDTGSHLEHKDAIRIVIPPGDPWGLL